MNETDIANQHYLLDEQYKDGSNFAERLRIMQQMNGTPVDYTWLFQQICKMPGCRVLELGCGPGYLWQLNKECIPADWEITLSDFSPGMLKEAQRNLAGIGQPFTYQVIDAQDIPYADASFDLVIAYCMLYHVPDLPRAFAEIRRVLRPDGYFYASTFSEKILAEVAHFSRTAGIPSWLGTIDFSLENGCEKLAAVFSSVELRHLENTLTITEAEPLVELVRTGTTDANGHEAKFHELSRLVQQELERHGAIRTNVDHALFEASGFRA